MRKSFIAIFVALSALVACNKDNASLIEVQEDPVVSEVIPMEEAMANLEEFLSSYTNVTRAVKTRNIADAEVFTFGPNTVKTKSDELNLPDTLMYVVNFADDNGFAILSANRRLLEDVYCVTESGSVTLTDLTKAYNGILNRAALTTRSSNDDDSFTSIGIDVVPQMILSAMVLEYQLGDLIEETDHVETRTSNQEYGPWLDTKWKQKGPFNDLIDQTPENTDGDVDWPCGCTTIAVAQIVNYVRLPVNPVFNGVTIDWDLLSTVYRYDNYTNAGSAEAQRQAANFLYTLGSADYCATEYGKTSSGADAMDAKRAFKKVGFKNLNRRIGCVNADKKRITEHIQNRKPIWMSGFTKGDGSDNVGHAWVVDGVMGNYFHINWGWNGECDGYFTKGVFCTIPAAFYDEKDLDRNPHPGNLYNFEWTYRYLTYDL